MCTRQGADHSLPSLWLYPPCRPRRGGIHPLALPACRSFYPLLQFPEAAGDGDRFAGCWLWGVMRFSSPVKKGYPQIKPQENRPLWITLWTMWISFPLHGSGFLCMGFFPFLLEYINFSGNDVVSCRKDCFFAAEFFRFLALPCILGGNPLQ